MKKLIFTLSFLFLTQLSVYAEDKPQAMLVFDASGSMWGQINGEAKISIAKNALNNVVSNWDKNVHLGLIAYGHRKKGDCNDIQTLVPIGQLDKKGMITKVKAIKPKGKTPISRSLKKAAEGLRYTEEKATVILISDGKETCDADPCATAKALEVEGIDFVAHVIGFDVDKQTGEQLKCIADSTGGEYFSAKNASSLNDAMGKIAEKVQKEEPKPPVVKKLKNNLEITASEKEEGKWISAYHQIYKEDDGERGKHIEGCPSKKQKSCVKQLPIGKYIVESTYNKLKRKSLLQITAGELTKLHIVMGQTGKFELTASEKEEGKWISAYHQIYKEDDGERGKHIEGCPSKKQKSCVKQLPIGKYIVESTYNKLKRKSLLQITAGELTKLHIVMGQTGKFEITASEKEEGKWVSAYHQVYKEDEGERGKHIEGCPSKKQKSCVKQLPVGKYIVESTYNQLKRKSPLQITAGELTKLHIVMGQTSKIEITASEKEGGRWVKAYHQIYKNDEGERGSHVMGCSSSKQKGCFKQLPIGKYVLQSSTKKFKKDTFVDIESGETTKTHIVFVQFQIGSKCSDGNASINHEVYATNGRMVYGKKAKCSDVLQVGIDNGNYSLESTINNVTKTTKFSVGADHPKQITIDMLESKKEPDHQDLIDADKQSQSSSNTEEKSTSKKIEQSTQTVSQPPKDNMLTKGLADLGKRMETMSKQNQMVANERKANGSADDVGLPSAGEVQGAMRQAGALINGLRSLGKDLEKKPLEGVKESIRVAIPKYQSSIECYEKADDLSAVEQCELIEKEILLLVEDQFLKATGFKSDKKIDMKQHTEWNDDIKQKTVLKKQNELKEMKLTLSCFDQGAGFLDLERCIKANGKHTAKKSEFEQLGNLLNALGGMAKTTNQPAEKNQQEKSDKDDAEMMKELEMFSK